LAKLVDALLLELPEENASAVIVVKTERPSSAGPRPSSVKSDLTSPGYNPGMLYTLELATVLAIRDAETIESVGENLAGSLQGIVRDARNVHPLIVSRVLYYLLNLLRLSYVSDTLEVSLGFSSHFLGTTIYAGSRDLACYFQLRPRHLRDVCNTSA
jgi:brefeldin A-resistance guanine nucleotide exchange factor 1